MKHIEIEDDLYAYIASQTQHIGEGASEILRRLLLGDSKAPVPAPAKSSAKSAKETAPASKPVDKPVEPTIAKASVKSDIQSIVNGLALDKDASRVERFLALLGAMHQQKGTDFSKVLEIKGRNRVYFGTSKDALLAAGSSTNPKQIPDSEYWVVTNNNTDKKCAMLTEVAKSLGYSEGDNTYLLNIITG